MKFFFFEFSFSLSIDLDNGNIIWKMCCMFVEFFFFVVCFGGFDEVVNLFDASSYFGGGVVGVNNGGRFFVEFDVCGVIEYFDVVFV